MIQFTVPPRMALIGSSTCWSVASRKALAAERKAEVLPIVRDLQAAGVTTLQGIADALNAQGLTTPRGRS